jgi:hypothetical protein
MNYGLRERFARLGRVRAIDRVSSGSPAAFVLGLGSGGLGGARTISAALALAKRGLPLGQAKRAVEQVVEHGRCVVELPTVEDVEAVRHDLALAGFAAVERHADAAGELLAKEPAALR